MNADKLNKLRSVPHAIRQSCANPECAETIAELVEAGIREIDRYKSNVEPYADLRPLLKFLRENDIRLTVEFDRFHVAAFVVTCEKPINGISARYQRRCFTVQHAEQTPLAIIIELERCARDLIENRKDEAGNDPR